MTARVLALLAGLALTAGACDIGPREASGDVASGPAGDSAVAIVATDDAFTPTTLDLASGTEATLEVANEGSNAHNLVIDELDLSTGTIDPGEVVTATFTVPDEPVDYVCTFHPGMSGRVVPRSDG